MKPTALVMVSGGNVQDWHVSHGGRLVLVDFDNIKDGDSSDEDIRATIREVEALPRSALAHNAIRELEEELALRKAYAAKQRATA